MLFNSLEFALFLPVVFALYWTVMQRNLGLQNIFIVFVSYIFYGWWDWRFLSLIIFSSLVDFWIGRKIADSDKPKTRKILLQISLAVNLGLLGIFKYYDFFVTEFVAAFGSLGITLQPLTLHIILPVGISFYTFQTLSYTIDVYRKKIAAVQDWKVFFAYVSFFPQLVAGPIERATNLIPQFQKKRIFEYSQGKDGMRQILWGLFKKIVIADNCAPLVTEIFDNYQQFGAVTLALGAILFAFQIYCDFSGYSDIAIGTARLFGFRLMRNFAYPYFARDIAEFWRKWHISLSTWFRDYVYIPLGGSRVASRAQLIRNILIIFLVSGFWHGANWTFLVWGILHALYFLPSILSGKNRQNLDMVAENSWLPSWKELLQMLLTFSMVCLAWVFFRAESIGQAFDYLALMFTNFEADGFFNEHSKAIFGGIALLLLIEWWQRRKQHGFEFDETRIPQWARSLIYLSTALTILVFGSQAEQSFIYFQF